MTATPLMARAVSSREESFAVRTASTRLNSACVYGAFALLLFGPLAFGAVEPWSRLILESGSAILLMLWAVAQVKTGELNIAINPVFAPMLAFGILTVWQVATHSTAYRYATISELQLYCSYGALCFVIAQCLRRTSQVRSLALSISVYGFMVAAFAIVQGMSSNGKLYWMRAPEAGGWIYGPYVNHDHYAGLMELLAPVPLIFALSHFAHGPKKIMAAISAAVMSGSIFLSGSRGGMAACAAQLVLLAVIVSRQKEKARSAVSIGVFAGLLVAILVWIGGGDLSTRVASIQHEARTELSGGTRMDIVHDSLRMFLQRPLLGSGLGTFPDVYPQFRSFYSNLFVNAAHNDYVQLLSEMGVLGFAVMLWFFIVMFRKAIGKLEFWRSNPNGAVALAAMIGCAGILVHSLVDYNLQIPANAALFYVWCTLAAMDTRFGTFRRRHHISKRVTFGPPLIEVSSPRD